MQFLVIGCGCTNRIRTECLSGATSLCNRFPFCFLWILRERREDTATEYRAVMPLEAPRLTALTVLVRTAVKLAKPLEVLEHGEASSKGTNRQCPRGTSGGQNQAPCTPLWKKISDVAILMGFNPYIRKEVIE